VIPFAIFAVDDDPTMRVLLSALLGRLVDPAKVAVHVFEDAASALVAAVAAPPAILFTDLQMPGMGGLELCRRLKADPATAAVPLVAVSGTQLREEALAAGCALFLPKPIRARDLAAVLAPFLGPPAGRG
jgi:CheY-like chemotaxis protein